MLNTEQVLTRLHIDHESRTKAVQQVREQIESSADPLAAAKVLFEHFVPPNSAFTLEDPKEATMTVQYLVQDAIMHGDAYDPEVALIKAAKYIKQARVDRPWAFKRDEQPTMETVGTLGTSVNSVEVKADGKIKKGGKQVLAAKLYAEHSALDNKDLIKIFEQVLDMSTAGARTYVYNLRKANK